MKTHQILPAASNLLGITLLIIAGLHLTDKSAKTFADEIAWGGALCFSISCWLSYLSIRKDAQSPKLEGYADGIFMGGLGFLTLSILVLAIANA